MDCGPTAADRGSPAPDDSDDEPLIKKKMSAPVETAVKKDNTSTQSNGTDKEANDLSTDDNSNNEPLIKTAKVSLHALKKPFAVPPKKSVDIKKTESLDDNESSDDEPLSELSKKVYPKRDRRASGRLSRTPARVMKSKRSAARKTVKYAESSSDFSDNEPLLTLKRKLTNTREVKKTSPNGKKTKPQVEPMRVKESDSSTNNNDNHDEDDDDDDVPLAKLTAKKEPAKTNTKTQKGSVKQTKTRVSTRKQRDTTPKKPRKMPVSDGSSDHDDDDDVPLGNPIAKKKPVKKNTKTTAVLKGSESKKRQGSADESSDDEPLVNVVKKNRAVTKTKMKASSPKERDTSTKKPREPPVSGSSSNNSDDKPLIKPAQHPQVTKTVRVTLQRCDTEETGATQSLDKTSTDTPSAKRSSSKKSKDSPEEESANETKL